MREPPKAPFDDTMMRTIVFYGLERKPAIREAMKLIRSVCELLNEQPTHVELGAEGRRERKPRFAQVDRVIETGDFDKYWYIGAKKYFEKNNLLHAMLAVNICEGWHDNDLIISYVMDENNTIGLTDILNTVRSSVSPRYGIMYDMREGEGPRWFASGVVWGGMTSPTARMSAEFADEYRKIDRFSDGFLRDVYGWNYIAPDQLDRVVNGVSLRDWIDQPLKHGDSLARSAGGLLSLLPRSRGVLSILDNGHAVWELTPREIADVRPHMLSAGLLLVKS